MIEFNKLELFAERRPTERRFPWSHRLSKLTAIANEPTRQRVVGVEGCETRGIYALQFPSLLQVFGCRSQRKEFEIRKLENVTAFALHGGGRLSLAGDAHGAAHLFSLQHKSILKEMPVAREALRALCFEAEGERFAAASEGGALHFWDFAASMEVWRIAAAHSDTVRRLRFLGDESLLATASLDRRVRLFDVRSRESVGEFALDEEVEDLDAIDGKAFCAVHGRKLSVWDLRLAHRFLAATVVGAKSLTSVRAVSGAIVTAGNDGALRCFDAADRLAPLGHRQFDAPIAAFDCDRRMRSLAVATIGAGFAVLVRGHEEESGEAPTAEQRLLARFRSGVLARDTSSYKFFGRGIWTRPTLFDAKISRTNAPKLTRYERFLRKFHFGEALEDALQTRNTAIIIAVIESLSVRSALSSAVEALSESGICLLLQFCTKKLDSFKHRSEVHCLLSHLFAESDSVGFAAAQPNLIALLAKTETEIEGAIVSGEIAGVVDSLTAAIDCANK